MKEEFRNYRALGLLALVLVLFLAALDPLATGMLWLLDTLPNIPLLVARAFMI